MLLPFDQLWQVYGGVGGPCQGLERRTPGTARSAERRRTGAELIPERAARRRGTQGVRDTGPRSRRSWPPADSSPTDTVDRA
ncbi:hypothetical protein GPN2_14086 [Streptomyces murinus]